MKGFLAKHIIQILAISAGINLANAATMPIMYVDNSASINYACFNKNTGVTSPCIIVTYTLKHSAPNTQVQVGSGVLANFDSAFTGLVDSSSNCAENPITAEGIEFVCNLVNNSNGSTTGYMKYEVNPNLLNNPTQVITHAYLGDDEIDVSHSMIELPINTK